MNSLSTSATGSPALGAPRGAARIAIAVRSPGTPGRRNGAAARWALRPASWIRLISGIVAVLLVDPREILELDQSRATIRRLDIRARMSCSRAFRLPSSVSPSVDAAVSGPAKLSSWPKTSCGSASATVLVHPRGEARLLPADPLDEQLHDLRVELGAGSGDELGAGILGRHRLAVRALGGHGVVGLEDR